MAFITQIQLRIWKRNAQNETILQQCGNAKNATPFGEHLGSKTMDVQGWIDDRKLNAEQARELEEAGAKRIDIDLI